MPQNLWNATRLFNELSRDDRLRREPETAGITAWLTLTLPGIETVLRSAGTSPSDFTLHNDEHAFRVAEKMAQLVPEESLHALSTFEIALLLLSSYLHDIGMTPHQGRVHALTVSALGGPAQPDHAPDVEDFQRWMRASPEFANATGLSPTIPDPASLARVRRAIAHYCRSKHNDWSQEWIASSLELPPEPSPLYAGFSEDLIELCRSHHYGYERLVERCFSPKVIRERIVHLRFLACILRIADVLEVDPERTPEVILTHRDIDPSSIPYWYKDHDFSVELDDYNVRLIAHPRRAYIHRAIVDTADQIEEELRLCQRLSTEIPFESIPYREGRGEAYAWKLSPFLQRSITPAPGHYEYIDGAFRPNTDKVLQLLGSQELYSEPLCAVRELLQNAIDAVRERVAYDWLALPQQTDEAFSLIQSLASVTLELTVVGGDVCLVCADSGAGMSKRIISKHLLVSGASERPDVTELERACNRHGRRLGRTGKFGIGVLSYFLLANSVTIETRRHSGAGDDDGTGWRFTTGGVGDFGELVRLNRSDSGTKVVLALRSNVCTDPVAFWRSLRTYVTGTLTRVPCRFVLKCSLPESSDTLEIAPGWARTSESLTPIAGNDRLESFGREQREREAFIDPVAARRMAESQMRQEATIASVRDAIRWQIGEEVRLDRIGTARIHVPYFQLPGGTSPVYMETSGDAVQPQVRQIEAFRLGKSPTIGLAVGGDLLLSWRGMSVVARVVESESRVAVLVYGFDRGCTIEIDLEEESIGRLALSREWIQLSPEVDRWALLRLVAKHVNAVRSRVVELCAGSQFASISYSIAHRVDFPDAELYWIRSVGTSGDGNRVFSWERTQFPFTKNNRVWSGDSADVCLQTEAGLLRSYCALHVVVVDGNTGWNLFVPIRPTRILAYDAGESGAVIVPVWDSGVARFDCKCSRWSRLSFPDAWSDWVGLLSTDSQFVWNERHSFVGKCNWEASALAESAHVSAVKKADVVETIDKCRDPEFAHLLMFDIVAHRDIGRWNGIVEGEVRLAESMWQAVGAMPEIRFVQQNIDENGGVSNTLFMFRRDGGIKEEPFVIPVPGSQWIVTQVQSVRRAEE